MDIFVQTPGLQSARSKILACLLVDIFCSIMNFILSSSALVHSYWWYYPMFFFLGSSVYQLITSVFVCASSRFPRAFVRILRSYIQFRSLLIVLFFVAFDVTLMMYFTAFFSAKP